MGEIRATIERKTIRAPFSGVLGLRQVNLGQYLSAGDPIVPLQSLNPIYVNFGIPQQEASSGADRPRGSHQRPRSGRAPSSAAASPPSIPWSIPRPGTSRCRPRSPTRGTSCGPACSSRPSSSSGASQSVIAIPTSGVNYAPYGDSVFVVTDLKDEKGKTVSRRAAAVRQAGWRRAAIRWRFFRA